MTLLLIPPPFTIGVEGSELTGTGVPDAFSTFWRFDGGGVWLDIVEDATCIKTDEDRSLDILSC